MTAAPSLKIPVLIVERLLRINTLTCHKMILAAIFFKDWGIVMVHVPFARKASKDNTFLFLGGIKASFLVDGADTQGQYAVVQMEERKGLEPPPHIHTREDEAFYVLEGEVTYYVGDEAIDASPGTYVYAPSGIQHTFSLKTEQAKVLVFAYPSGFENFVKELSVPLPEHMPPVPIGPPSPEDVQKLNSIAAQYGIEIQV
ncbi:cupin domain-containing protein [Ammoniphilus sp. 3BR4]|uniref:cupin domain-containing protein n=1 Tax=Ammoniphilus sp. 3BR4 TaxID=3158265 RepID=UPI00346608D7